MSAPRRRSRLFATSAIGAIALAALWAAPSHAQLVQGAAPAQSNGAAPVINQAGGNTTVTLNGSRTVIDWDQFDINGGDTADFVFASRSDIVLNRVGGAASTINGNLNGMIGAGGPAGGNIWIYNANGVVIGANARISTGGLLVTTAALDRATDSTAGGFLDGSSTSFGFSGAADGTRIDVRAGAQVNAHGGAIALIAPIVTADSGSSVTANGNGNVLVGSASSYRVTFRPTGTDDFDLLSFEVANGADGAGSAAEAINLGGDISGNRVFVAAVSKSGLAASILNTGTITATTAATDETGAIVLSANHNIVNGAVEAAPVAGSTGTGFVTTVGGALAGPSVTAAATEGLMLRSDVNAAGGTVDLRSDNGDIRQFAGVITADTVTAAAHTGLNFNSFSANRVTRLGALTTDTGDIAYIGDEDTLELTGMISAPGKVTLGARDYINTTTGLITVGSLELFLGGGGAFKVNGDANLGSGQSNGAVTIQATGNITLANEFNLALGDQLTLTAGNAINETTGFISGGGSVTATAVNALNLGQANQVSSFTATSSSSGGVNLRAGGTFSIVGGGTSGTLDATSDTGNISGTGVDVSRLTASAAAGSIDFSANTNAVRVLGNVTAGGSVWISSSHGLSLTGNISGADVNLSAQSLTQAAGTSISAGHDITLNATAGAIDQDATASLHASNWLEAHANTDVLLRGTNDLGYNDPYITAGAGADVTIRSVGGFVYHSYGTNVGTLTLISDAGDIRQFGGLTANTLVARAATGINLNAPGGASNAVTTVGELTTTSGDITFLEGNGFDIAGDISAPGTVSFGTSGAIETYSGKLSAGTLVVTAGGGASFDVAGNLDLGAVNTAGGGNFTLVSDGDIRLTDAVTLGGSDLHLDTSGAITRSGGTVSANVTYANAGGGIDLAGAGFANFWATSTGGGDIHLSGDNDVGFMVNTAGDLTVVAGGMASNSGDVVARSVGISAGTGIGLYDQTVNIDVGSYRYLTVADGYIDIENQGDINLDGDVTANGGTNGNWIRLNSTQNSILQNSGTINGYSVELKAVGSVTQSADAKVVAGGGGLSFTGTDVTLAGANEFPWLSMYSVSRDLTLRAVGTLDMSWTSNQAGSARNVTLVSDTGNVNVAFGVIDADKLSATAVNGSITVNGPSNNIRSLGTLTAKSTAGTDINIFTDSLLSLTGNVTGGGVNIYATQGIDQTAGAITADRLATGTSGNLLLGGANDFGALADFGHGNGTNVTIRNLGDIVLPTTPNTFGTLTLTSDTGSISQAGGLTANTLVAHAATGIGLNSLANDFTRLAGIATGAGDVRIRDTGGLAVDGNITAPGTVLLSTTGAITTTSGKIDADTLTVVGTNAALATAGDIKLGGVGVNSGFTLTADGGIELTDNLTAIGVSLSAVTGAITQSGGTISATTGGFSAAGNVTLGAGNHFTNFFGTSTDGGNITLNNAGAGGIVVGLNTTGSATVTAGGNLSSGGITVDSLSVSAGHIDLTNSVDVNSFTNLVAAYGDVLVTNNGSFTIAGDVSASKAGLRTVDLRATGGAISQIAGTISSHDLQLRAAGDVTQSGTGRIDANASYFQGANLDLMGANSFGTATPTGINVGGTVRLNGSALRLNFMTPAGDVTLTSSGDISTSGGIQASSLTATAGGQISLEDPANQIGTVHGLRGTSVALGSSTGFTVDGDVTATAGNVILQATSGNLSQTAGTISGVGVSLRADAGAILQSGTGKVLATAFLTAIAQDDILLGGANDFDYAASGFSYSAGSDVTLRNRGGINFTGGTVGALSLTSDTGAITQTGAITADSLAASGGTGVALANAANAFATIGAIANTGSGGVSLVTTTGLNLQGNIAASGQTVSLKSGGAINQTGGAITAGTLSLDAAGSIDLIQNYVSRLGKVTAGGTFQTGQMSSGVLELTDDITAGSQIVLTNSAGINQTGGKITSGGNLFLNAGTLTANGDNFASGFTRLNIGSGSYRSAGDALLWLAATGDVSIVSTGSITFSANGASVGDTLNLDATNGIGMAGPGASVDFNHLGTIINRGTGGITLTSTGAMDLTGNVTAADQAVSLTAAGAITQDVVHSAINTDSLQAIGTAGISLLGANDVGSINLDAGGNDLRFRNLGDIAIGVVNAAGHAIELASDTGSVTQDWTTGALIGSLTVRAAGAVNLLATNNQIEHLDVTSGGNVGISTGGSGYGGIMTVDRIDAAGHQVSLNNSAGAINGGNITADLLYFFALGADLTTANNVRTLNAHTSSLDLAFTNMGDLLIDMIVSPGADVSLRSEQGAITQNSNALVALGGLTAYGRDGIALAGTVERIDGLAAGPGADISLSSDHALDLSGDITARNVELLSNAAPSVTNPTGGMITQSGGVITADRLIARARGDVTLDGANAIAGLGWIVSTTGNVHVKTGGALDLGDLVQASNGTVTLEAGSLSQSGGTIETGSLDVAATGAVSLGMTNLVAAGGTVSLSGSDIEFRNDSSVRLGTIAQSGTAGGIDLTSVNGSITQVNGGSITGAFLTARGINLLELAGNNHVARIGDLIAQGGVVNYLGHGDFALTGDIVAAAVVQLASDAGTITQTGGSIRTGTLNLGADNAYLDQANAVDVLGGISVAGDFTFRSAGDIQVFSDITGQYAGLHSDTGSITQYGGRILTSRVDLSADGSIALTSSGNAFNYIGSLVSAHGDVTLVTSSDIYSANLISAANGTVDLTVGRITADAVVANLLNVDAAGDVEMTGDNVIAHLGNISGDNISLAVGETDITGWLQGTNSIAFVRSGLASDFALTMVSGGLITTSMISLSNTGTAGTATLDNIVTPSGTLELNLNFNGDASISAFGSALSLNNAIVDGDLLIRGGNGITNTGAHADISGTLDATALSGNISLLFGTDRIGHFGAITVAGPGTAALSAENVRLAGNVVALGGFRADATGGSVTQSAGSVITAASVAGSATGGDMLLGGNNLVGTINGLSATGNLAFKTSGALDIAGALAAGTGSTMTLTAGGNIGASGGGLSGGTLSVTAAGSVDLSGVNSNFGYLGDVSATSFALHNTAYLSLSGIQNVSGTMSLVVDSALMQNSGHVVADTLNLTTIGSVWMTNDNRVNTLGVSAIPSGGFVFNNEQNLTLSGLLDAASTVMLWVDGDLTAASGIRTIAGLAITANGVDVGALEAGGRLEVNGGTHAVNLGHLTSSGDVWVLGSGPVTIGAIDMLGMDGAGNGFNVRVTGSDITLGAAGVITSANYLTYAAGITPGSVSIEATANARVALNDLNAVTSITASGDVDARSLNQLLLGDVSGANVTLVAGADLQANSVTVPGTYSITAADFGAGAFNLLGNPLDITITDTSGDLNLSGAIAARRDLTVTAQAGDVLGAAARLGAGLGEDGTLRVNGANIALLEASGLYDVALVATGTVDAHIVSVGRNYTLSGTSILDGALAPVGAQAGVLNLSSAGDLDLGGGQLVYAGGITFNVQGLLRNGALRSTGSWVSGLADAVDLDEIRASDQIDSLARNGAFRVFHLASDAGFVSVRGASVDVLGSVEAASDIRLVGVNGDVRAGYATWGRDMEIRATNGDAVLRQANLTGAFGSLTLQANGGTAILGADTAVGIGTDRWFESAAGSAGSAFITGDVGAFVNLDHSAVIGSISGADVAIDIANGDLTLGQLTAGTDGGRVHVENGSLTIGGATVTGGVLDLQADGDLVAQGALGGLATYLTAGALLDTRAAAVTGIDHLELTGGEIRAGALESSGDIDAISTAGAISADSVHSTGGDAIFSAHADLNLGSVVANGGQLQAGGNATLRAIAAPDGFALVALGSVTLGADTVDLITGGNTLVTGGSLGGCACGTGGATVTALGGDVRVNLLSATGVFDTIASAIDRDAIVHVATGDLGINALAGHDIAVTLPGGTLTVMTPVSSGGDYALTARDLAGNALDPTFGGTATALGNVTIIDLLGDLGANGTLTAAGDIHVEAQGGGLTGALRLLAGGDVGVTGQGIRLGDVAGRDVTLDAGTAAIHLTGTVTVDRDYSLTGGGFSVAALTPAGARTGTMSVNAANDFDLAGVHFQYNGNVFVHSLGAVRNGDISAGGGIQLTAQGVDLGALDAGTQLSIQAGNGDVTIAGARAGDSIDIRTATGDIGLGAASFTSTAGNLLSLTADTGAIRLGSIDAASITAGNVFTGAGSSVRAILNAGGYLVVNLASSGELYELRGSNARIAVQNGDLSIGAIEAGRLDLTVNGDVGIGNGGIGTLGTIAVANGDFSLTNLASLDIAGTLDVRNGAVDLRLTDPGSNLTQSSGVILAQRLTGSVAGTATLGGDNEVGTLGAFATRGLVFNNRIALAIGGLVDGTTGAVTIRSHGGMTIDAAGSVRSGASGDAILLASDGAFRNLAGADALDAQYGRWLVYSQAAGNAGASDPANDFGGLAGRSYYGSAYDFDTGSFAAAPNAGNRFVYGYRPVLTVTPDGLRVTYAGAIPALTATVTGLVNGDSAADAWSGAAGFSGAGRNAGNYAVDATLGSLASDVNYAFAFGTGTLVIDPRVITAALVADDRTYNGNTDATGHIVLAGVLGADQVSASGNYAFDGRNAGTRTVTATGIALSGADAGNYVVNATATDLADILARIVTATLMANDRTYDGTIAATGALALSGVLAGDDVGFVSGGMVFDSRNTGTRSATATGIALTGADAGNYVVNATATDMADILARAITATLTASDRTYDGTTDATGTLALSGVLGADQVSASGNYAFDSRNAGTGRIVTASGIALSGADAGNYVVNATATDLADILARAITATLTANDRTYDGTIATTGTLALNGVIAGDTVGVTSGGVAFDGRNAGTRTATAIGIALSGADAGNYVVNATATDLADILARAITVTLTANDKTYDGATGATGTLWLAGLVAGDQAGVTGSIAFDSRNAGERIATASGLVLTGADASNYSVGGTATDIATILRRAITGTAIADSRIYDGTAAATGRIALDGVLAGDVVSAAAAYAFADPNAGTNRIVSVNGLTIGGADAGNYSVTLSNNPVTADILRRPVAVMADDLVKLFGQPDPAFTWRVTAGSLVGGDAFTGALTRAPGEQPGIYAISQGSLALSANYLLTVTPGSLVVRFTSSGADASDALKELRPYRGFATNDDPSANLEGDTGEE